MSYLVLLCIVYEGLLICLRVTYMNIYFEVYLLPGICVLLPTRERIKLSLLPLLHSYMNTCTALRHGHIVTVGSGGRVGTETRPGRTACQRSLRTLPRRMFREASVPVGLCVDQEGHPGKSSPAAGDARDPVQATRNVAKEQRYQLGASVTGAFLVYIIHVVRWYWCRNCGDNRGRSRASIINLSIFIARRNSWGGGALTPQVEYHLHGSKS